MQELAHKVCVGLFKQDPEGAAYTQLLDADYSALKWGAQSIIPSAYRFTNINRAGSTVETTQTAFITDLSKIAKYKSGRVTPGAITLASMLAADVAGIHSILRALTGVDDPYLCLLTIGSYKSGMDTAQIVYDVFWASAGILIEDGAATAEAGAAFTGNFAFQPSGVPVETIAANGHILTWNTTAGTVTLSATSGT